MMVGKFDRTIGRLLVRSPLATQPGGTHQASPQTYEDRCHQPQMIIDPLIRKIAMSGHQRALNLENVE